MHDRRIRSRTVDARKTDPLRTPTMKGVLDQCFELVLPEPRRRRRHRRPLRLRRDLDRAPQAPHLVGILDQPLRRQIRPEILDDTTRAIHPATPRERLAPHPRRFEPDTEPLVRSL